MKKIGFLVLALLLFSGVASAQLSTQATANVTVIVSQQNSITLTQTSGGNLVFDPVSGVSNQITLSSFSVLDGTFSHVNLGVSFSGAAALTATGGSTVQGTSLADTWSTSSGASSGTNQPCSASGCGQILIASTGSQTLGLNPQTINTTFSLAILNYASLRLPAGNYQGTISFTVIAT